MEDNRQWKMTFIGEISRFRSAIYRRCSHFSNGPDDVGRWQRATFIFFFFLLLQGTSIGLVRTNHALLSLVDTNLA